MSDGSSIEWTDATWQVCYGCTRVSSGCDACYAMSFAHRGLTAQHRGLTKVRPRGSSRPGVDWNGEIRLAPENLGIPLRWKKPRRVFVNSMSDLFHERVPFEFIAAVFGVMAARPQHTFLVLTKRPQRAREFFEWIGRANTPPVGCANAYLDRVVPGNCWALADGDATWPLANVHIGVSVEDQATWDERVPLLLQCPAAVRWVSAEPLLGPVWMRGHVRSGGHGWSDALYHLDWIVVGGESGPRSRPFNVEWARSILEQCADTRVPAFMKQVGARPYECAGHDRPAAMGPGPSIDCRGEQYLCALPINDRKGGDPNEWPADLRVRQYPEVRGG